MKQTKPALAARRTDLHRFAFMALVLLALLSGLFWKAFLPGYTVFSNDGPLGAISSECGKLPAGFFGFWQDLNWLGGTGPGAPPDVTQFLNWICSKLIFSKIFAPFAAFFLGLSAWICFRQWKFSPLACALGGLAAGLNSDFLSTATWGVASQPIAFGLDFLALAALADQSSSRRWLRTVLGGFAVGMTIMEAFDIGALFSIVIAAYVLVQALLGEGANGRRLVEGVGRLVLVVICSALIAVTAVSGLIGTQIKGVADMGQDTASKAQRWGEATQWSLPKKETLAVAIPGLFGFRMDTPKDMSAFGEQFRDGAYWGMVGSDPAWDRWFAEGKKGASPQALARFNGGGIYAGILVILVAAWASLQSFRKQNSVFSDRERKLVWFWLVVAFGSLLLAYGRFAPFYQLVYALPYASTIRNPAKFIHVVEWALLIIFAYGINGLSSRYMGAPDPAGRGLKAWWAKAGSFDRGWVKGSGIALGLSLLAWFVYDHSHEHLAQYIQSVGFDPAMAGPMADFSSRQVGWAILFLALGLAALILALSGYFSGSRARAGGGFLGILLVADLFAADLPYIVVWDYPQKYASNPVIDQLREPRAHPYEQRVAILPFPPADQESARFRQLYEIEWKQHHWQYYNIQSLDIIMMPRRPEAYVSFEGAMRPDGPTNLFRIARRWQLTNTRYLLGAAGYAEALNKEFDPVQRRFRVVTPFAVELKPGITACTKLEELTAVPKPEGPMALIEFTGALPRAKLYANWQVHTNDQQALAQLAGAEFDPERTVIIDEPATMASSLGNTNVAGTVSFVSYAPKRIQLKANASASSVLLLNDKHDPNWLVSVDGKPATLLRCNFLMQGVRVPPGTHSIEFEFSPPVGTFYVSLAVVLLGLGLLGYVAFSKPTESALSSP